MCRYFIDKLNIPFEQTPQGICHSEFVANEPNTRGELWHKEREKYGFDSRETWDIGWSLELFLYERLCLFKKVNNVDLAFHKYNYKGSVITLEECLDRLIEGLALDITLEEDGDKRKDSRVAQSISDIFPLLQLCLRDLWW
jgi:hypothetical protein